MGHAIERVIECESISNELDRVLHSLHKFTPSMSRHASGARSSFQDTLYSLVGIPTYISILVLITLVPVLLKT